MSFASAISGSSCSSHEQQRSIYLPEGERDREKLDILNEALISISDGTFSAFPNYINLSWDELSKKAKENHIRNVKDAVMLVLGTVAPSQEDAIWQSLLQSELSRRDPVRCTFDVGLEAILQAYKECKNKSTKIQILSLICNKYSVSELQEFIPGISVGQIKNARKHAEEQGPGEPKTEIFRCRLDMKKVNEFIDFISRSTFLQDVALRKNPAFVRTMTASKIVYLYQEECKQEGKLPLIERTCFRILEVCAASKQKSLQGLDNTSTEGVKAFESLESLVDNLTKHGAEAAWAQETVQKLIAGKQYLKGEYKCHLGSNEMCADHCTVYFLSVLRRRNFLKHVSTSTISHVLTVKTLEMFLEK